MVPFPASSGTLKALLSPTQEKQKLGFPNLLHLPPLRNFCTPNPYQHPDGLVFPGLQQRPSFRKVGLRRGNTHLPLCQGVTVSADVLFFDLVRYGTNDFCTPRGMGHQDTRTTGMFLESLLPAWKPHDPLARLCLLCLRGTMSSLKETAVYSIVVRGPQTWQC